MVEFKKQSASLLREKEAKSGESSLERSEKENVRKCKVKGTSLLG